MCIIVYKPANVDFPSWNTLKTCFEHNPNGAGYMFSDGKQVHIRKGFMTWAEFKKDLKPYKNGTNKYPFVMHFRITTHGGTSQGMTHPFPLSSSADKLKKLYGTTDVGIAHNGIIQMCGGAKNLSDTAEFIKDYLTLLIKSPKYYKNHRLCDIIEELIGSKMCILSNDTHVEVLGHGWTIEDGIYYSNSSYKKYSYVGAPKSKYSNYSYGGYYGGGWSYIEEDDVCEICGKPIGDYDNWHEVDGLLICDDCKNEYYGDEESLCEFERTHNAKYCETCELTRCVYFHC